MIRRLFCAFALVLPMGGLGWLWISTHDYAQQGRIWEVPVSGYDPADLLRGHYIRYRYQWPGLKDDEYYGLDSLCLVGKAPAIASVHISGAVSFEPDPIPEGDAAKRCDQPVRAARNTWSAINGLQTDILYVSQTRARELQHKFGDEKLQGVIRIRVRDDGLITPVDLTFRPKPAETPAVTKPLEE
ncbi:MAG: hypothetical protein RL367_468 [Pseudomonadota bacterium]